MADNYYWTPNTDLSQFYSGNMTPPTKVPGGLAPTTLDGPKPSTTLKKTVVKTVPINPMTGQPYSSQTRTDSVGAYPTLADMFNFQSTRPPPNEVVVPGGTRTDVGYRSGTTYPDSYRLMPEAFGYGPAPAENTAVAAINRAMPMNLGRFFGPPLPPGYGAAPNFGDGGLFGTPMSGAMQEVLANDPAYGYRSQSGSRRSSGGSSAPVSFAGVSTGKTYNAGQTYQRGDGSTAVANADGSFTDTKTGRKSTGSSAGKSNVGGNYQSINVGSDGVKRGFNLNTNRLEVIR